MTITTLDDDIRKEIEPNTSSIEKRLAALKQLKESGLETYVFVGPILPFITDWESIIETTKNYVDSYMFENLNMHGAISMDIYNWIGKNHNNLLAEYKGIHKDKKPFWDNMEVKIEQFGKHQNIDFKMYFDHKKQSKT